MNSTQIIFAIVIILLVVASIVLGNVLFTQFFGVDVQSLPPFLKFLVHATGGAVIGYLVYKFLRR